MSLIGGVQMKSKLLVLSALTILSLGVAGCSNNSKSDSKDSSSSSVSKKSSTSHKTASSSSSTTSSAQSSSSTTSSTITTSQFSQSQLATMIWMYDQQRTGAASDFLTNTQYYDGIGIHHFEGDTSVGSKHANMVTYKVTNDAINVTTVGETSANYSVSINELVNKYYSTDSQKAFTDKIAAENQDN